MTRQYAPVFAVISSIVLRMFQFSHPWIRVLPSRHVGPLARFAVPASWFTRAREPRHGLPGAPARLRCARSRAPDEPYPLRAGARSGGGLRASPGSDSRRARGVGLVPCRGSADRPGARPAPDPRSTRRLVARFGPGPAAPPFSSSRRDPGPPPPRCPSALARASRNQRGAPPSLDSALRAGPGERLGLDPRDRRASLPVSSAAGPRGRPVGPSACGEAPGRLRPVAHEPALRRPGTDIQAREAAGAAGRKPRQLGSAMPATDLRSRG